MGATMAINFSKLNYLQNLTADDIPETYQKWVCELDAPTIIDFTKEGNDTWRVVTTLLHGNEQSGFAALHDWIKQESYKDIAVNIRFIVCSVEAAQFEPMFSTRFLSGGRDINRCFGIKSLSDYYLRAELIASCIRQVKPEAVIDLHNTSGKNPPFGVSCHSDKEHLALVQLFSNQVIVSHLKLGALMELDFHCPIVTIECGGKNDLMANRVALEGIEQFCQLDNLFENELDKEMEVIYQPVRLKLKHNIELTFSEQMPTEGISIRRDIEDLNFGITPAGTPLGWVDEYGLQNIEIEGEHANAMPEDYFEIKHNQLVTSKDMRIFMATTKRKVAVHDCLFYLIKEQNF